MMSSAKNAKKNRTGGRIEIASSQLLRRSTICRRWRTTNQMATKQAISTATSDETSNVAASFRIWRAENCATDGFMRSNQSWYSCRCTKHASQFPVACHEMQNQNTGGTIKISRATTDTQIGRAHV